MLKDFKGIQNLFQTTDHLFPICFDCIRPGADVCLAQWFACLQARICDPNRIRPAAGIEVRLSKHQKKCAENARKDGVILVTLRLSTHISTFYNNLKIMFAPSLIFLEFQHKIQAKAPNKGTLSQSAWDNLGHPPAWHATAADTVYERAMSFPIPFKARA